jgi:hypothetical protein
MLWSFVIVGKTVATIPDARHCFIKIYKPCLWWRLSLFFRAFSENWMERILREHMLDIGHEQFLVLLFVMYP